MNQTVLLVEDDLADSKLIRRAFDKAEVAARLVRARDGDDAVAYLDGTGPYTDRDEHPSPTLVLLDIKLPRRSGFEVLSWIRRDMRPLRRTPVVMLTSSRHAVDINRAYELGANAYTVKPDTQADMIRLLGAIQSFWIQSSEPPLVASAGGGAGNAPVARTHQVTPRRVLLIEDDPADAALITRAFDRAQFAGSIEHVLNARAGLEWLRRRISLDDPGEFPGLVLLDLKLPGMSGLEFLREMRSMHELRQIPVVVLATAHDADTINRAYEQGANSYLVKTPDPDEVNRLIQFVKQYWLSVNQGMASVTS
ncbi:MAG TPA: response regulator [Acidobacteriaceae bacterium]